MAIIDNPNFQDFKMTDMLEASDVEFVRDYTGKIWVNVNGVCLLRVGRVHNLAYKDEGKRT